MALGQLYIPKGKALDTARAVLEVENVYACNVAQGCTNMCTYCWLQKPPYSQKPGEMKFSPFPPVELVRRQIERNLMPVKPEGVFLSFLTDPFLDVNWRHTEDLVNYLLEQEIKVATLSKSGGLGGSLDTYDSGDIRTGMSIASLDEDFRKEHEPNTSTIGCRLSILKDLKEFGYYTWVSIEPYPTPEIWNQELLPLLEELSFADFLLFGKWNYDWRAENLMARIFYRDMVKKFEGFCQKKGIRHFVKPDTLKFIGRR